MKFSKCVEMSSEHTLAKFHHYPTLRDKVEALSSCIMPMWLSIGKMHHDKAPTLLLDLEW